MRTASRSPRFKARVATWIEATIVAGLGLGLTILAAALVVAPPTLITYLDYRVYDTLLSHADLPPPSDAPVLIGIDDASLQRYGQWPWPRYRLAQLIDRLNRAGARVIALDLLMPEPDRTSPEIIFQERRRDLGKIAPALALQEAGLGNDQLLAAAIAKSTVVLGYRFDFSPTGQSAAVTELKPLQNAVVQHVGGAAHNWPIPTGVMANLPLLAAAAPATGFTNAASDEDGILRRVPLLIQGPHGVFPSLALAALLCVPGQDQLKLIISPEAATIHWNGREIPLDGQGNLLLAFRPAHNNYRYLSAAEVLAGTLPERELQGRLVIVGAWAAGLGDSHVTPIDKAFPGMAVHALVIDNLLTGKFLEDPPWAGGAQLFSVIVLGLLATFLLTRYGFMADLLVGLLGSSLIVGGVVALFMLRGIYLSPVMPLLLLLANCGFVGLLKYGIEARKVYVRTCELALAQDATILGMTLLASSRDLETGAHILRTQRYVETLARDLGRLSKYRAELTDENIELLFKSAPLHDIGKVGIPDAILRKPGSLDEDEYRLMKKHTLIGSEALAKTQQLLQQSGTPGYLDYACQVTISHHEKWDGSGYPNGLKGEEIPLAGRLMALADVYDALISERIYKAVIPHEQAREIILARSGTHFDPEVVATFLRCEKEFQRIAHDYARLTLAEDLPGT